MQMPAFEKHVWAEIDLDALRHNFRAVKARAGEMPLCAVVKADSYGHGAVECAKVFAEEGAAWLAVSCLAEARQLRKAGLTLPILILGHVEPGRVPVLIQEDITAACYSLPQAKALSEAACAAGGKVKVHLKADTGMGRIGFALRTDFDAALAGMLEACRLPGCSSTSLWPTTTAPTAWLIPASSTSSSSGPVRALPRPVLSLPSSTATTPPG